jgi:tetratricopeptide (TPR) repeat protein
MKYFSILLLIIFYSCAPTSNDKQVAESSDTVTETLTQDTCQKLYAKASQTDLQLMRATVFDKNQALNALVVFDAYTSYCKIDTITPVYLIKSAQLARSVNNYQKASMYLKQCIDEYVRFENRAAAMFLLAQLYDDTAALNNETEAKALYEKIIKEFPSSEWAMNSKAAIQMLGKSDEQMIQEFLKKNK